MRNTLNTDKGKYFSYSCLALSIGKDLAYGQALKEVAYSDFVKADSSVGYLVVAGAGGCRLWAG